MNEIELNNLQSFEICNKYGKIKFEGRVDLRSVNLDTTVIIKHQSAEVYPDDVFNDLNKPIVGEKLNRTALITLYDISPPRGLEIHKFVKKL